jgi:hypothetical protein
MDQRVVATRRAALLGVAACAVGNEADAETIRAQTLFVVARSKNANVVHYDARIRSGGELDGNEPVVAYWRLLAEDGRREELGFLERRLAYGFDAVFTPDRRAVRLLLRAFPVREARVERGAKGRYQAVLSIAHKPARLERIYVATDERGVTPSVRYVELFGVALGDAARLSERIKR